MQSQRMIGQQSLAEFMGIRLAPDVVRFSVEARFPSPLTMHQVFQDNEKRTDAKRKNGYIVNAGSTS